MSYDFTASGGDDLSGQLTTALASDSSNQITLGAWVKRTLWDAASVKGIVQISDTFEVDTTSVCMYHTATDTLNYWIRGTGTNYSSYAFATGAYDAEWVFVAAVYRSDVLRDCYIEDSTKTDQDTNSATATVLNQLMIGNAAGGSSRAFLGLIAEVCIWDIALTTANIDELQTVTGASAAGPAPNTIAPNNVVAYYPLNTDRDTPGTILNEATGPATDADGLLDIHGATYNADHPIINAPDNAIKTDKIWTRQPPPSTKLDWSNPITRGLRLFGTFKEGVPWDEVLQESGAWDTNGNLAITEQGPAGEFPLATLGSGATFPVHVEIHNGLSAITLMTLAKNRQTTTAANQGAFAHTGSGDDPWEVTWENSNDLRCRVDVGATLYTDRVTDGLHVTNGADPQEFNLFGGTWYNDVITARVNKVKGPGTATSGTIAMGGENDPTIGARSGGGAESWDGWVVFGAMWDRALSDVEWNSMVANPWQVFKPAPRFHLFGGAPATSVIVDDVNGTEIWNDGSAGLVITGTGFV